MDSVQTVSYWFVCQFHVLQQRTVYRKCHTGLFVSFMFYNNGQCTDSVILVCLSVSCSTTTDSVQTVSYWFVCQFHVLQHRTVYRQCHTGLFVSFMLNNNTQCTESVILVCLSVSCSTTTDSVQTVSYWFVCQFHVEQQYTVYRKCHTGLFVSFMFYNNGQCTDSVILVCLSVSC